MLAPWLLETVACPLCLEAAGCPSCARPAPTASPTEYRERIRCGCGGPDKMRLREGETAFTCPHCGVAYPVRREEGYIDLVPRTEIGEVTQYADHEFHERLHVVDAPPLLSARVKADMMRLMLEPRPGELLLDLGCGPGKMALYASAMGARIAGLDVAPFFLARATREVALVLGDLRRLPFRRGSFPGAYSLDVLEHLEEPDLVDMLVESRRILKRGGGLFVYTHAMESGRLGPFQRGAKDLARRLGRWGLLDYEREVLRKSDHKNAIRSHEHFEALCADAGFYVAARRYYNVFFKAILEDLLFKLYEQAKRGGRGGELPRAEVAGPGGPTTVGAPAPGRLLLAIGAVLTLVLKLDVVLFGGSRTGPFFGLLRPARGGNSA
jgi:ubiquinone/menaquinone biosynthesis C-methylase UbiE